jgi:dolichyl-phosphooligosaccharide-protein glycotransferase
MEGSHYDWWRRHGWTVAILLSAFAIALAIRTIWAYPIIEQFGPLYSYAGGSDSYYHSRVTTYIILNHQNLVFDPLIHFPIGGYNPREPLFDWMNAILGLVFAPAFGGNAVTAGAWFLDLQPPLWSALGVFPIYLIGREVASKRVGLIAALIFPFLSANIDSSIFGYANYLSFYTFVILVTVYAYLRTLKAVGTRRWVDSYRKPGQYLPGLRAFLRTERTAVKWAVFTGVSLGALALAWQGYTYAIVVIGISLVFIMIAERIRHVDSFGVYVTVWIIGLIAFPMAVPYYLVQHQFASWFDLPLLLFFGTLALMLPFLLMRDIPWVFSIPALIGIVLAGAAFLAVFEPRYFTSIITGQGYLVKTLIYSTVAEDVAPSIDELVVGYGVVTFFLAFAGIAMFVYLLVRGKFKRFQVAFLVFAVLSIYLPISAAKFFLLGSPAFALLPAIAIDRALDIGGYPELRRTVASLSDRRSQFAAFRKAFKPRHVLILLVVVGIVLPNVWVGIDAGIPGNTKAGFSEQVYDSLPGFLKGNSSSAQNYFGAAGTSIDTSAQYDSAGYNWLATQDTNLAPAQRPALVSWWDYGFQTIDQGQHPSVADNFQNGIDPAGQFLLAQNESNAIAILAITLLQAEQVQSGQPYLPPAVNAIIASEGLNVTTLHSLLVNQSADYTTVVAHPERYLPVDPSTLTDANAMYMALSYYLATALPLSGVSSFYDALQSYTGWSIRYDLTDSRLIPFTGTDTGIYYAPAELTGRVVSSVGLPSTYFNVTVLGSDGNYYALGSVPADVTAVQYYVNYFAPFYNSMIFRTYFGYNGTDIGQSVGIPGLLGSLVNSPIEPGWMLQHFQVVYKTAYYCASAADQNNSACYTPMNQPTALALAQSTGGVANTSAGLYFSGGESMLAYYPGQTVLGKVQLPSGAPVGGVRVTVFDQWGIPHETVLTAADGSFSVVLPPGNDTLNITTGSLIGLLQQGSVVLKTMHVDVSDALGYSLNAPNLPMTVTLGGGRVGGFVYWNSANETGYVPTTDALVPGAQVVLWGPNNMSRITTTTDASGSFSLANVPPGVYNYDVLYGGQNYTQNTLQVTATSITTVNATVGLPTGVIQGYAVSVRGVPQPGAVVTLGGASGIVARNTTNASGGFRITGYAPGNYTLLASLPGTNLAFVGASLAVANVTTSFEGNVTLVPTTPTTLSVSAGGVPEAGVPVRIVPIAGLGNGSESAAQEILGATNSAIVATTGPGGSVSLGLPDGNYSVSAVGYVGSTLDAGLTTLAIPAGASVAAATVPLGPAVRLSGSVTAQGAPSATTIVAVVAFSAAGTPAYTWAVNGSYQLYLPAGTYGLYALQGSVGQPTVVYAALTSVALSAPTSVPLVLGSAVTSRFTVGIAGAGGSGVGAPYATATLSAGSGGAPVTFFAGNNSVVTAVVPSVVPSPATGYCLAAAAPGFSTTTECGISPNGLAALTQFAVPVTPVPVTVRVVGGPSGTVSVNMTGVGPATVTQRLSGGPTFSFTAPAGAYNLTGWAPTSNTSVLYRQTAVVAAEIPYGASSASFTLVLASQTNTTGTLTVPSGTSLKLAYVALTSPTFNLIVNGSAFTKTGFYAPPGTYSAYATLVNHNATIGGLTVLAVGRNGKATPTLAIANATVTLSGTLVAPSGSTVAASTTVHLTAPSGATVEATAASGAFSLPVLANTTYTVSASATTTGVSSAGNFPVSWSSVPGTSCAVGSTTPPSCSVPMVPTAELLWLNGTLSSPGVPGPISGTVRLTGPTPYANVTVVAVTNGTFSVRLLPGVYSVYATGGGASSPLAALTSTAVVLGARSPLSISLAPAWTVTILASPPTSGGALRGSVNVTVASGSGPPTVFPGVASGGSITIALPIGVYTLGGTSYGTSYGQPSNASASETVSVVRGNVGATLPLAYVVSARASATFAGASSATVTSPGTATFAFSVAATGNVPLAMHPVGSPAYWGFAFSFSNVTLVPGGSTLTASVVVQVPAYTPVAHPGVTIAIVLANGTTVATLAPTVNVVPTYGVAVGRPTGVPVEIGPTSAVVPFYLANSGTATETVALSVVDLARLSSLGWTASFLSPSRNAVSGTVTLAGFSNATYFVNLTAIQSVFVPVGSVAVQASVVNESGAYQAHAQLPVPKATVAPTTANGTGAATVSGPSVGAPPSGPPDWVIPLVSFVPAIALVVGVLAVRWWRTRRWTHR